MSCPRIASELHDYVTVAEPDEMRLCFALGRLHQVARVKRDVPRTHGPSMAENDSLYEVANCDRVDVAVFV